MDIAIVIEDLWGDGADIRVHSLYFPKEKAQSSINDIKKSNLDVTEYYVEMFNVHE